MPWDAIEDVNKRTSSAATLDGIETPALVLDVAKMERNVARLTARLESLGVGFRPHVKTSTSIELARLRFPEGRVRLTVSTTKDAGYFAHPGLSDVF